jgi:hypothetical protein
MCGDYALLFLNAPAPILVAIAPYPYIMIEICPVAITSARSWNVGDSYHVYASGLTIKIDPSVSVVAAVLAVT